MCTQENRIYVWFDREKYDKKTKRFEYSIIQFFECT